MEQAADHATKYKTGLISTINSNEWRHGHVSKFVPLLDDETIFLLTEDGQVEWTGKQQDSCRVAGCFGELCQNSTHPLDDAFLWLTCEISDDDCWMPFKVMI